MSSNETTTFPPGLILDNKSFAPEILSSTWSLTALAGVFLGLRVFAKLYTRRGLWLDDYVLILSWLIVFVVAILTNVAVLHGFGKHVYNVAPQDVVPLNLFSNIIITLVILSAALSKTSFAITVLRLVSGWMTKFTWFIIISMNFILSINIVISWLGFRTTPRMGPPTGSDATAAAAGVYYGVFATAYSAVMDFVLVGVAWYVVSSLRALRQFREKLGVGLAMSMGLVAGISSVVKAAVLPQLLLGQGDPSFVVVRSHICSMAEAATTIIAVSVPLLRVLFLQVKRSHTAVWSRTRSRSHSTPNKPPVPVSSGSMPSLGARSGRQVGSRPLPGMYEMYLAGVPTTDMSDALPMAMNNDNDENAIEEGVTPTQAVVRASESDEEQALPLQFPLQDFTDAEPHALSEGLDRPLNA